PRVRERDLVCLSGRGEREAERGPGNGHVGRRAVVLGAADREGGGDEEREGDRDRPIGTRRHTTSCGGEPGVALSDPVRFPVYRGPGPSLWMREPSARGKIVNSLRGMFHCGGICTHDYGGGREIVPESRCTTPSEAKRHARGPWSMTDRGPRLIGRDGFHGGRLAGRSLPLRRPGEEHRQPHDQRAEQELETH